MRSELPTPCVSSKTLEQLETPLGRWSVRLESASLEALACLA